MPFKHISTRVSLLAGGLALVVVATLSSILIGAHRRQVLDEMVHTCNAVADSIRLGLTQDMLENTPQRISRAIESLGQHADIEGIRLYKKDGTIAYSSSPEEVGGIIDIGAEGCVECHGAGTPLRDLPLKERSRIYRQPDGRRVLATINVIPNEPACATAGCHGTLEEDPILGVLDVGMPLAPVRERLMVSTRNAVVLSIGAVAFVSLALFVVIRRTVLRPVQWLVAATERVAHGDYDAEHVQLPDTSDEIGFLSRSFNEMVESLASSEAHRETWIRELKDTVASRALELRTIRSKMVQAEKLSATGLIAAGIAHELNSPLMAIITFAHLLRKRFEPGSSEYEDLTMIREQAERCADIIRNLLDFAREPKAKAERAPCRIDELVGAALELVRPQVRSRGVRSKLTCEGLIPKVHADSNQLTQVFVNLLINAVHAMPDGGDLTLRVMGLVGGEQVSVVVRDTGHGIRPEHLDRVFDPFFTTKETGQGFGLGLSVSYGIVRRHKGTISVDSDGKSWTEFTVTLPAIPASDQALQELSK